MLFMSTYYSSYAAFWSSVNKWVLARTTLLGNNHLLPWWLKYQQYFNHLVNEIECIRSKHVFRMTVPAYMICLVWFVFLLSPCFWHLYVYCVIKRNITKLICCIFYAGCQDSCQLDSNGIWNNGKSSSSSISSSTCKYVFCYRFSS